MNYEYIIKDIWGDKVLRVDDRNNIQWEGFRKDNPNRLALFNTFEEA